jgi:biopolymer transport protein ExbD
MIARGVREETLKAEVNMTPLVDVVLVLPIIFMVVTPLLRQEVPIELPLADSSRAAPDPLQITVSLAADGRVLMDGVEIAPADVVARLTAVFADRPEKTIFLEADRSLSHGRVVDLMDDARAAGVVQIGVVTKTEKQPGG